MDPSQVFIMKQDVVPSVKNLQCELATESNGHLIKKPHGHGDVHFCLYRVNLYNYRYFIGWYSKEMDGRISYSISLLLPRYECLIILYHDLHGCFGCSTKCFHGQYLCTEKTS